jgi:hypothetical protein
MISGYSPFELPCHAAKQFRNSWISGPLALPETHLLTLTLLITLTLNLANEIVQIRQCPFYSTTSLTRCAAPCAAKNCRGRYALICFFINDHERDIILATIGETGYDTSISPSVEAIEMMMHETTSYDDTFIQFTLHFQIVVALFLHIF